METSPEQDDDDYMAEFDFTKAEGVVRGKYAARYREQYSVVRLAADVAKAFPDEAAVNEALRVYLREHPEIRASA